MTPQKELPTVDDFLRSILKSGILNRDQLQEAMRLVPAERRQDSASLAEALVNTGTLSRFQADKLLKGIGGGLVVSHYHVLAPLGRGGMGTVWLARDTRSQLLVALKVLPPKKAREEDRLLARFRREMEMSQRVSHPHLAWACEVGVWKGTYFIALEYIPGKTLYRLVQDEGPLTVPRAARLFAEVASALDHAHHQALIHRDLKPSNIIVTPHDHAKLLDLGLALVQGEAPADRQVVGGQGYVVGTMDYIAPEQSEDAANVDPRTDLYSLGCTLYYALTGKPPFPGGTPLEKIYHHRSDEPTPVPQLNPNVPPGFIGLMRKMMAKKPGNRFQSAAEVREAFLSWASPDAQPLDRREDYEYQEAVEALEHAEAPSELLAEAIPVGILEPERSSSTGDASGDVPVALPHTAPPSPRWRMLALILVLAMLALGAIWLEWFK